MEGPRAPRETELPSVLQFLDQTLRPDHNWSLASEYPTAFSKQNIHNIRILTDEDRILSHAVMKPLIVKTPLLVYKIAAIGSVVTNAEHRGQGLSSQILESCLAEGKTQDCDFALLWTNLHDFYRKKGFELAGCEESICFLEEFETPRKDLQIKHGMPVAPETLLKLYAQHTVGTARTAEDVRKFLLIPQSKIHSAWDQKGQLVAYAIEGKGADLTDYIHEWGGSVSAIVSLMSSLRKHKARPFTMILPNHAVNLLVALQKLPITAGQGYLGMIKLLRTELLFAKIHRAARSIGIADLVLAKSDDGFQIGLGKDVRNLSDEKAVTQFLFGPCPDLGFLPSTEERLSKMFPLPLWVWGWDSV